jgi:hypothetical protein
VLAVASWGVKVRVHTNISSHRQRNVNISQVRFRLSSFVALSFSRPALNTSIFTDSWYSRIPPTAGREVVFAPRPSVELPVLPLHA